MVYVERKQLAVSVAQTIIFVVFGSFRALKPLRVCAERVALARNTCFVERKRFRAKVALGVYVLKVLVLSIEKRKRAISCTTPPLSRTNVLRPF